MLIQTTRRHTYKAIAVAILLGLSTSAAAQDAGSNDWKLSWTNTLRYNATFRVHAQDPALLAGANYDDGDRNFDKGLVSNRVELLSELNAVYRSNFGVRISAAGWYDTVYNTSNDNPGFAGGAVPNQSSVGPNQFTATTRRLQGRDVELRDAFVFYKFNPGEMPVMVRLGRHALVWGESLFFAGNGIAGAQSSFDIARLQADPTAQAKEFVLPVPQISAQMQITPNVSIGAYYQFDWRANRFPAVGSYFSQGDIFGPGAERMWVGPGFAVDRRADMEPKNSGQGGVQLRWNAYATDFGLYALRFHDKTPQIVTLLGMGMQGPQPIGFQQVYGQGSTLFGASASRSFDNVNLAVETSIRNHATLASSGGTADPSAFLSVITGFPVPASDNRGHPAYAVGRTAHVNVSTIWALNPSALWREATFVGEAAWNRVLSCEKNCVAPPGGAQALDPNGSRDAWGLRFVFTPMYRQIRPGLDLGVPIGVGYAPKGSRSLAVGPGVLPPQNGGDITVGLAGTYNNAWTINLAYTHFYGRAGTLLSSDLAQAQAPPYTWGQTLKDRDFVAFTVKRSF